MRLLASFLFSVLLFSASNSSVVLADPNVTKHPQQTARYADIDKLPDFSGVWIPDVKGQTIQETTDVPPWKLEILPQIKRLNDEFKAGRPALILAHCLPHGMPSWMLITHNAFEILMTPGRVTLLGEGDGNRMRRIYTDGRGHPEDPDPSLHGHSIGHWEKDVLIVDTIGISPQAFIAIS